MKITFLSLMLVLVISCKRNIVSSHNKVDASVVQSDSNDFFMQDEHGSMDTLYLDIVLADCGEWGGPQKNIKSMRKVRDISWTIKNTNTFATH